MSINLRDVLPSDDLKNYELVMYYNGSKIPTDTGVYKVHSDTPFKIPKYLIPELRTAFLVFNRLRLDNVVKASILEYLVSHRKLKDPNVNQMEQLDKDAAKLMERYLHMTEEERWESDALLAIGKTQLVYELIE
jgi:hypothetical protein